MKKQIRKVLSMFFMFIMFVCTVAGCGDKEIENLKVKAGTLEYVYKQNSDVSFDDLKLVVVYNDGTTEEVGKDDITISDFNTTTVGNYKVTFTYEGKTLDVTLKVTNNEDELYGVFGLELPEFISNGYNKNKENKENFEAEFYDKTAPYVVGDDNLFTFLPKVTAFDDTDTKITVNAFESVVTVYKEDDTTHDFVELTKETTNADLHLSTYKSDDVEYVVVDNFNQTYDFTEDAIGQTFKVKVMAYYKDEDRLDSDVTVEYDFEIVDGYNITTAKELGILNNDPNYSILGTNMYNSWVDFLGDDITVSPQDINGVVLHNNLTITTDDIPSQYFYNGYLKDTRELPNVNIYYHAAQKDRPFTLYGNYFTVDASQIPLIDMTEDDGVSQAALFRFTGNSDNPADCEASARIENLALIGNANRTNDSDAPGLGGVIGIKSSRSTTTIYNCIMRTFYISMYAEDNPGGFYSKLNIDYTKSYDSYQNALFMWGGETNITRSELKKAGGPLMILQHEDPDKNIDSRIPVVNVDELTVLESYVDGEEAWFVQFSAVDKVKDIKALSGLFTAHNISFIKDGKMNIIAVVMKAGFPDFSGASSSNQGKLVINNKEVANLMKDENTEVKDVIYLTGGQAPVFESDAGGVGYVGQYGLTTEDDELFEGDYLTLYLFGMGIAIECFQTEASN